MKYIKSNEEFNELIKGKVLVDFYADWCGPCRMLGEVLESVSKNIDIEIVKVDTDEFLDIAKKYGVMTIPALKIFENGKVVKETVGYMEEEELLKFINE
jgi:thioredoxin 1